MWIYSNKQDVHAGGSGAGCSASVWSTHLLHEIRKGKYKRILLVGTGALLSPITIQQGNSIPSIAHAVVVETGEGETMLMHFVWAFLIGGLICVIAQIAMDTTPFFVSSSHVLVVVILFGGNC